MRKFLLISLLCIVASSYAQNEQKLDSLYLVWKDESHKDSSRVSALYNFIESDEGRLYFNPDSTLVLGKQLLEFSKANNNQLGIAKAFAVMGKSNIYKGNYGKSIDYYQEAVKIAEDVDYEGINIFLLNIGSCYYILGIPSEAHKYYELCFAKSKAIGDELTAGKALLNKGINLFYQGRYIKASDSFNNALKIFEELKYKKGIIAVLTSFGNIYYRTYDNDKALNYYERSLSMDDSLANPQSYANTLHNIGNIYADAKDYQKALEYHQRALSIRENFEDLRDKIKSLKEIALVYQNQEKLNKSLEMYQESKKISEDIDYKRGLLSSLNHMGEIYASEGLFSKAISSAKESLDLAIELEDVLKQKSASESLYKIYKKMGNGSEALKFHESMLILNDSLQRQETAKKLQQMEFEKKVLADSLQQVEKDLKIEIVHQKEKNKLTWGWGGSLSAVSILAFLVFRNVKQKQRKAEEERQKQIEEKEKILKDLELQTIDAMIAGQEKERQRLASDLHDSVGATLSAAKLQFNHLIKDEIDNKIREELIKKTSTLLEDAYVEIRSMAHLKNSGVIAKNGLLPAVRNLTQNASGINNLTFEVQSFGLEQRLDNSLEISIFRIIQELVTNIIKHANATKGIVYLTNHDNNLNVMIEDNGKGFNPKKLNTTKPGMGITSIDKRVEHLDGKFSIESEINKGTTVIIDIPL